MLENGSSNETPAAEQGPLSEYMSQMGGKCLTVISDFCKGQCTALDKVRTINAITDILSSASPLLVENVRDLIDRRCLVMWWLGPSMQFPQQSHMRLPRGLRWMKRTSYRSFKRASPVPNFQMSCRKPSVSCGLMLRISNSQNHQFSLLCLRHNF